MVTARALIVTVVGAALAPACLAQDHPGAAIYLDRCAGCHGVNLEGQPDWMRRMPNGRMPAPPHDASGHTWHHSDRQLLRIIKEGLAVIAPGYETDMPAFGDTLSDGEILAVLEYIKSTWPDRERELQAKRTAADTE
ncbi:cytochrome C [Devosia soli]|uniref:Cytochrome C n=1 Tax=Devosia soli TaxID=361041 RepID=A0A0F5L544_9HYPH|nr:cytochrome c [Devosia soli]KKB77478.1 cytochrome C [Devosia soli]